VISVFDFFFLDGTGLELWTSCLQSRCSIAWATPPVHFALVILEISTSQVARMTGMSHWYPARLWFLKLILVCVVVLGIELKASLLFKFIYLFIFIHFFFIFWDRVFCVSQAGLELWILCLSLLNAGIIWKNNGIWCGELVYREGDQFAFSTFRSIDPAGEMQGTAPVRGHIVTFPSRWCGILWCHSCEISSKSEL
jgi:hypothetical protein